ncbi:MAG: hypothetical protein BM560_15545 [Roseobacter sp. MedPE-SWde]|nr:MAG: hypothetical protein BM560_15545 [Roseobacter sp. MedPE-SWde]
MEIELVGELAGLLSQGHKETVSKGSFLEEIIELFRRETDIPLEFPLVAALSIVSGYLNALGARYEISGSLYSPKLWTVVLAASGSGKTFATDKVASWLGVPVGVNEIVTLRETIHQGVGPNLIAERLANIDAQDRESVVPDDNLSLFGHP